MDSEKTDLDKRIQRGCNLDITYTRSVKRFAHIPVPAHFIYKVVEL